MDRTDIFISGGGLAGLIAAAALGQAGFHVILADPALAPETAEAEASDLRSTAYLRPARSLIERAGLWADLAPHATPLDALRIIDTVGWPPEIRETRAFQSSEVGDGPFGWNLLNWMTRKMLAERLANLPGVELRLGSAFKSLVQRESEAIVRLTDGTSLRARLAIAADGRSSPLREAAGIGTDIARYGQKALAFTVAHSLPHENISTEIYNQGGAFTLVPAADHDGRPASAVVWMNDGALALDLMKSSDAELEEVMSARSCGVLGDLHLASPRRLWPVVTQRALALTSQRVALIAEAAHVLPPIGAQGLNTSLHDVAALLALAEAAPERLGEVGMLAEYERSRARDIALRARAIDLFNRICKSGEVPVQNLRLAGLRAVHGVAPLRRAVMRTGLGGS